MTAQQTKIGGLQVGIIILTLATAVIHFTLVHRLMDIAFVLNGLGYLALLAALYLPSPFFAGRRGLVRFALMGFAALTIIAWIAMGDKSGWLGYVDKFIEIVLIILVWLENQRSKA
jgi:hypothetical protein